MDYFLMIVYILGSIFLLTLIILTIKLIISVDRVNALLANIEKKVKSFDSLFVVFDKFVDSFALLSDRTVDFIIGIINKLFLRKGKDDLNDEGKG